MYWLHGTWAVLEKDLRLELRSRYALNTLLLFVASALLVVLAAVGNAPLEKNMQAALLWTVILFSAAVGLGRAFVSEEERGTVLLLQLNVRPSAVYTGKLLFNLFLTLVLNFIALGAFWVVLDMQVTAPGLLVTIVLLGAIGLAGATTLLAAIIARSANKGPLFAVLFFPILVPLLLSVVRGTQEALNAGQWSTVSAELFTLIGFAGTVITASVLLFDYVWEAS